MREAGIGRVLVASLHQGIADILPTRLGFYENWLNAEGLREGTIGLAPLYAVLSFLRQEGDAYQMITTRAGEWASRGRDEVRSNRSSSYLGVFVVALCVGGVATAQTSPAPARILVMPFENVTRDSRIVWLGEASAVLVADDLNVLGTSAITRDERRQAFERLQVPPAAALTDATVIRIGQLVGASQVVVGSLEPSADTLVVRARSIALEAGRIQADAVERGPVPELFAIFERVARRLAPA